MELYIPELKDYWYEAKVESDPSTMEYNAGYDVSYYGYHYDTGCIDFPEERFLEIYQKRIKENRFFAYVRDNRINEFVGYVNFQYIQDKWECGIVIDAKYRGKGYGKKALKLLCEEAKKRKIKELYDNFEVDRGNTLELFQSVGFEVVKKQKWKKFGKDVEGVLVRIVL